MKGYNLDGNDAVEKLASMDITGNVIPIEWFNHIKRPNGKPYADAIILLSDIVYWYRPIETRNETTGKLLGYRKKFKADKLQRSYGAFAEQYGYTKRQVTDALTYLKEIGIIDLDFRTIKSDGMKIGNVLFVGLNVDRLLEISNTLSHLNVIGVPIKGDTNTETTTETTTENTIPCEVLFPENLNTPEFKEKWLEWIAYRKEIKHPIKVTTQDRQIKSLVKYSPDVACAMIEQSITNGWQGIFPIKENSGNGYKSEGWVEVR